MGDVSIYWSRVQVRESCHGSPQRNMTLSISKIVCRLYLPRLPTASQSGTVARHSLLSHLYKLSGRFHTHHCARSKTMARANLQDDDKFKLLTAIWPQMPRHDFNTYKGLYDKYFLFLDEQVSSVQRKSSLYSVTTIEQFVALIQNIRRNESHTKVNIASDPSDESLRSIDIAVRIWLTVHVQHSPDDHPISFYWARDACLTPALENWLTQTKAQKPMDNKAKQIPMGFSVLNLINYYNFQVEWTSDLIQHLNIDWKYKRITIFEHGICLRNHLEYSPWSPLPRAMVEEAIDTIKLLFPDDKDTKTFLSGQGRTFLNVPYGRERSMSLGNYRYWQHNLADLVEHWEQGPKGWSQIRLNPDRGNLLEYVTFWAATIVLILTVMSIAFGVASLVLAKQALDVSTRSLEVSIQSYNLSLAAACAEDNATANLPDFCS